MGSLVLDAAAKTTLSRKERRSINTHTVV